MKLKPSMKSHRRYLLVKTSDKSNIEKVILDYLGILGLAKMNLFFVKEAGNEFLISIERGEVDSFRAAVECSKADIRIIKVSGTMKGIDK
jgi:RNase P/RNase MRP subunit POP5